MRNKIAKIPNFKFVVQIEGRYIIFNVGIFRIKLDESEWLSIYSEIALDNWTTWWVMQNSANLRIERNCRSYTRSAFELWKLYVITRNYVAHGELSLFVYIPLSLVLGVLAKPDIRVCWDMLTAFANSARLSP